MDGEIITSGEMSKANDLAQQLDQVINANPSLMQAVGPSRDFLHQLAWKGTR